MSASVAHRILSAILAALGAIVWVGSASSQSPRFADKFDISGFFDVLSSYEDARFKNGKFGFGQVEIDLATEISPKIGVEMAVAYDHETHGFGIGAAFIDWHLRKPVESHLGDRYLIDHAGVIMGQFDVPFGIDYHVYPSPDRRLVTAPLVVELTHCAWNDVGVQVYGESRLGNAVVYAVNGFASSATVHQRQVNLSTGEEEIVEVEVDTTPEAAFGGRLGAKILNGVEVGGSYAVGLNRDDRVEMAMYGVDACFERNAVQVKGEGIWHDLNKSVDRRWNRGYYLEGTYSLGRPLMVLRRDAFKPEGEVSLRSWSMGAGYRFVDNAQVRIEYQTFAGNHPDGLWLQSVVSF